MKYLLNAYKFVGTKNLGVKQIWKNKHPYKYISIVLFY